jgi:hypothetical protein
MTRWRSVPSQFSASRAMISPLRIAAGTVPA